MQKATKYYSQNERNTIYPFGMLMRERTYSSSSYRYGYQGSEKDDEIYGKGNGYTTEFRALDPRSGRWWSIDPEQKSIPGQSPYASMNNNPISILDILGNKGTDWYENKKSGEIKWYDSDAAADKGNGTSNSKDLGKNVLVGTDNRDANFKEPINTAKFDLYLESNKTGPSATIVGNTVPADGAYGTLKEGIYPATNLGDHAGGPAIWINNGSNVPTVTPDPLNGANFINGKNGAMKPIDQQVMNGVLFHPGNPYATTLSSGKGKPWSEGCQTGGCGKGSLETYKTFSKNIIGFKGNYYLRTKPSIPVITKQAAPAVQFNFVSMPADATKTVNSRLLR